MLTLKQLRAFVALAESRNFRRAAAACRVSQPALSAQIQLLEQALGTTLFERTKRRVLLTEDGGRLLEQARAIVERTDRLVAEARAASGPLTGSLRLGAIPTLGPYLLPRVLPELRAAYPDLRLYLREEQTERLLERLQAGSLDAALLALPVDRAGLVEAPLFDEPFLLAVPAGHPLGERAAVRERDLAGEPVLLLEDGHCFRDQALAVCGRGGAAAEPFAATSLPMLREMVAGRLGVTLLPALAAGGGDGGEMAVRPFADPAPGRRIGLVWRSGSPRAADLTLLAGFVRSHLPPGVTPAES